MPSITIDRRFCGPPNSGNGGYVCGLLAGHIDGTSAEITLRAPPPLGQRLDIIPGTHGTMDLRQGEHILATGRPTQLEVSEIQQPAIPKQSTRFVLLHLMKVIITCPHVSCVDRRVLPETGCASLPDP